MKTDELFQDAVRDIVAAKTSLDVNDFDNSLVMLGNAYADIRALMEEVWEMKRRASKAAATPGEKAL